VLLLLLLLLLCEAFEGKGRLVSIVWVGNRWDVLVISEKEGEVSECSGCMFTRDECSRKGKRGVRDRR
jgi:hypothetical protein